MCLLLSLCHLLVHHSILEAVAVAEVIPGAEEVAGLAAALEAGAGQVGAEALEAAVVGEAAAGPRAAAAEPVAEELEVLGAARGAVAAVAAAAILRARTAHPTTSRGRSYLNFRRARRPTSNSCTCWLKALAVS